MFIYGYKGWCILLIKHAKTIHLFISSPKPRSFRVWYSAECARFDCRLINVHMPGMKFLCTSAFASWRLTCRHVDFFLSAENWTLLAYVVRNDGSLLAKWFQGVSTWWSFGLHFSYTLVSWQKHASTVIGMSTCRLVENGYFDLWTCVHHNKHLFLWFQMIYTWGKIMW